MKKLLVLAVAVYLQGCVSENATVNAVLSGAADGCGMGALMTVWVGGVTAAVGCGMGAMGGAIMGLTADLVVDDLAGTFPR